MPRPYRPYIPKDIGEILDHLVAMLASPKMKATTGYFPGRSVDTEFFALNEGMKLVREKLGDERYAALVALSDRMRAHFEADPEDRTGEANAGRALLHEMDDLLTQRRATEANHEE